MSENKKIGFDIFENSDINTVEEIGTEKMNIDKITRDRMLKITMDKYAEDKKHLVTDTEDKTSAEEYADSVTGVDNYKQKRFSRIIYFALCSAAAAVIVAGSLLMLNRQSRNGPHISDPVVEVTTVTTDVSLTTDINTATGTTAMTTASKTSTSSCETNDSKTGNTTATKATATAEADENSTVTTASNAVNPETSENVDILCSNPHTDRRDITQEELDKSCMRMLGELENAEDAIWNIKYAYNDVNNDGVPELFIGYNYIGEGYIHMFVYDGEKYTPASFKSRFTLEGRNERTVGGQNILICPEENLIFTDYLMGMSESQILEIDKDNSIKVLNEFYGEAVFSEGKMHPFVDFAVPEGLDDYNADITSHSWKEIEYTVYCMKNAAAIKVEKEFNFEAD